MENLDDTEKDKTLEKENEEANHNEENQDRKNRRGNNRKFEKRVNQRPRPRPKPISDNKLNNMETEERDDEITDHLPPIQTERQIEKPIKEKQPQLSIIKRSYGHIPKDDKERETERQEGDMSMTKKPLTQKMHVFLDRKITEFISILHVYTHL